MPDPASTARQRVKRAEVTSGPIGTAECTEATSATSTGAAVTFAGLIRDNDEGRHVVALAYSAHPTAQRTIEEVATEVAANHPEVLIAILHRVGELEIGDCALACAVTSAHRIEAFAACAELVDAVKQCVPIWKQQIFADGTSEWVNSIS